MLLYRKWKGLRPGHALTCLNHLVGGVIERTEVMPSPASEHGTLIPFFPPQER